MPIYRWWVIQQKNIAELQPQECPHGKDITMDEQVKEHRGFIGNSLGDGPQPVGEQTREKPNQVHQGADWTESWSLCTCMCHVQSLAFTKKQSIWFQCYLPE